MRPRGPYFILVDREPVAVDDMRTWSDWHHKIANRRVAETTLSSGTYVSTVCLGLDHQFSLTGPPLLFETLVFGGPLDGETDRYSTWSEAEVGHHVMVGRVKQAEGL